MTNRNYKVYMHTTPNNKVYIGITKQPVERRWRNGEAYKYHTYFYRAIQKYGWDNIKHEVIFDNLTEEEAKQKEIELIEMYSSTNQKHGYNRSAGGESGSAGYKFTEEQKQRLSEMRKGEKNSMYGKHHSQETIEIERVKHLKENLSPETINKMSKAKKGKKRDKNSIEKQRKAMAYIVVCSETLEEYIGSKEAGKDKNIDPSCITKVCRGERKTAGGYHWYYKEVVQDGYAKNVGKRNCQ